MSVTDSVSGFIKAAAEAEKLWIMYNLKSDQAIDFNRVCEKLVGDSESPITLTGPELQNLYDNLDASING